MRLIDFDYHLPAELIAQAPLPERDASRMMVLKRNEGLIDHSFFHQIDSCLEEGDVLVVNDSKVIPARLTGTKKTGGVIEILLLTGREERTGTVTAVWEALLKPAKRVREGTKIDIGEAGEVEVLERISDKRWRLAFRTSAPFSEFLHTHGSAPLPPYIKRKRGGPDGIDDLERYQTIYARVPGSVAAPTAGFHFSAPVLERLARKGVATASVTLHVGYGTFLPIETDVIEDHAMEAEWFELTSESAALINRARRVIAVGTTATRVIESVADETGLMRPASGSTSLFIYPGYRFKRVNGLLTNFHLPKSSLFLLASAFAGTSLLRAAYRLAVENQYRFYSYGDCTLIL